MKTSLFDFDLPPERIATEPVSPRDSARMLVVKGNRTADSYISNLPDVLQEGDLMIFNNTRVIPARLHGKRGNAAIAVTLHKPLGKHKWRAFVKPGKKLKLDDIITFADDFSAQVFAKHESGEIDLQFECKDLHEALKYYGSMPLPPYMKRNADSHDIQNYQTIYAKHEGAVAAPTAGLHFTDGLFATLKEKGIKHAFVTLHVGGGTFLPVKVDDTANHKMHSEYAEISAETANLINATKNAGRRIISVGTTSLRVLETASDGKGVIHSFADETDIFITPGYQFRIADVLLTNFHLPRSTLFMLVSAFTGLDAMKDAYSHAIQTGYRFYSYGDACLLFNSASRQG